MAEEKKKEPAEPKLSALIKEANLSIKNKKDQEKAEKNLLSAVSRSSLTDKERAQIMYECALLEKSINDGENLKAYLKQNYDTLKFYSTVLKIHQYVLRCDSFDVLPDKNGKCSPSYRKKGRDLLLTYRKNLLAGGRFLLRKEKWQEAYPYLDMYLKVLDEPLMNPTVTLRQDTILPRVTYWATIAAYYSNNSDGVLTYVDASIPTQDHSRRATLQEYKCKSLLAKKDTVMYEEELYNGAESWPLHDYFFLSLEEMYKQRRQYDYGEELADTMLSRVQDRAIYWYTKGAMRMYKQDWEATITFSNEALNRDTTLTDAYYNKGLALLNLALSTQEEACNDLNNPQCLRDRNAIKSYYQQALPAMEMYRRRKPDASDKWAPPLYRIYLYLNMGDEFEEIENWMK